MMVVIILNSVIIGVQTDDILVSFIQALQNYEI